MHAAMVAGLPISWRTGNPDGRTISAELADGRTVAAPGPSRHCGRMHSKHSSGTSRPQLRLIPAA
jgi:hypothetical protein